MKNKIISLKNLIIGVFKNKKLCFLLFGILFVAVALFVLIFSSVSRKEEGIPEHQKLVDEYVNCFINDDAVKQYALLDNYIFNFPESSDFSLPEGYRRSPLVKKHLDVTISNTEEGTKGLIKKINNVYRNYCLSNAVEEVFTVDKAYKYNIKINFKGKLLHNLNLWVVSLNGELKICTVFEYERSIDRGYALGLY